MSPVPDSPPLFQPQRLAVPELPPPPRGYYDFARRRFAFPLSADDAEQILVNTEAFETGVAGPVRQVHAFNVLFDAPDAIERFQRVSTVGGHVGRLYALCALRLLRPDEAERLARRLKQVRDPVLLINGDMVEWLAVAEVVDLIGARGLPERFRAKREETAEYYRKAG